MYKGVELEIVDSQLNPSDYFDYLNTFHHVTQRKTNQSMASRHKQDPVQSLQRVG